jgi:hypothetical protein
MKMLNKKVMLALCSLILIGNALIAQDVAKYTGATTCKMCHNSPAKGEQWNKWNESAHSKALASLSSTAALEYAKKNGIADPAKEAKCLKCHSTASTVDAGIVGGLKADEGVSCESCHGPGSLYKAMNVMKDTAMAKTKGLVVPNKETCLKCHIEEGNPFYKPFDYDTFWAKIAHKNPAKK